MIDEMLTLLQLQQFLALLGRKNSFKFAKPLRLDRAVACGSAGRVFVPPGDEDSERISGKIHSVLFPQFPK